MNVFAKFNEIPPMLLQDIKETKRYRHTFVRSFVLSFGWTDMKTVYPPTNTVCGGYNDIFQLKNCDNFLSFLLKSHFCSKHKF